MQSNGRGEEDSSLRDARKMKVILVSTMRLSAFGSKGCQVNSLTHTNEMLLQLSSSMPFQGVKISE